MTMGKCAFVVSNQLKRNNLCYLCLCEFTFFILFFYAYKIFLHTFFSAVLPSVMDSKPFNQGHWKRRMYSIDSIVSFVMRREGWVSDRNVFFILKIENHSIGIRIRRSMIRCPFCWWLLSSFSRHKSIQCNQSNITNRLHFNQSAPLQTPHKLKMLLFDGGLFTWKVFWFYVYTYSYTYIDSFCLNNRQSIELTNVRRKINNISE